jgi:hypothetical protein
MTRTSAVITFAALATFSVLLIPVNNHTSPTLPLMTGLEDRYVVSLRGMHLQRTLRAFQPVSTTSFESGSTLRKKNMKQEYSIASQITGVHQSFCLPAGMIVYVQQTFWKDK